MARAKGRRLERSPSRSQTLARVRHVAPDGRDAQEVRLVATVASVRLAAGARTDGSVVEEEVLVTALQDNRFRLLKSPGLVLGLAAGDAFEVTGTNGFRVLVRGGNICVQVFVERDHQRALRELDARILALGGSFDGESEQQLVYTVPAAAGSNHWRLRCPRPPSASTWSGEHMRTREEFAGLEYDWLGVDEEGHVGFFSGAGGGALPESFLRDPDSHEAAIEELLASAPTITARSLQTVSSDAQDTWRMMAERGLFAFDSDPNGGPYCLMAAPDQPTSPDSLSERARLTAQGTVLRGIRFPAVSEISNEAVLRVT